MTLYPLTINLNDMLTKFFRLGQYSAQSTIKLCFDKNFCLDITTLKAVRSRSGSVAWETMQSLSHFKIIDKKLYYLIYLNNSDNNLLLFSLLFFFFCFFVFVFCFSVVSSERSEKGRAKELYDVNLLRMSGMQAL